MTILGCDGSAEPQAVILEVSAAFDKGQVWISQENLTTVSSF